MRELRPGLWHWGAPHPDWQPSEPWRQEVSSYASDDGERLLLFDAIAVPEHIEELAASRETAVVLTAPWHERDARGYPHDLQGEKIRPQFLYSTTRSLFEEVGFSYERPKGKKNCVMRTAVSPVEVS